MSNQELVPHSNNHAADIVDFAASVEAWQDPVTRRDYFEHLSPVEFLGLTQQVASIVRTGDADVRQPFDGHNVSLMTHQVPDYRDKEDLLLKVWGTAQTLLRDRNVSDGDALEYAALTTGAGILYTHPFADGNGRTSRALSFLISTGAKDGAALSEALDKTLQTSWQLAPKSVHAEPLLLPTGGEQPGKIDWEFQFAGEEEDAFGGAIAGSHYSTYIVQKFIETADEHTKEIIESCATRSESGELESVDGDKLLTALAADEERGVDYARMLLGIERDVRKSFVERYLGGMLTSDYRPVRAFEDWQLDISQQATDGFRDMALKAGQILQSRQVGGKVLPRDEAVALHRYYSGYHKSDEPR